MPPAANVNRLIPMGCKDLVRMPRSDNVCIKVHIEGLPLAVCDRPDLASLAAFRFADRVAPFLAPEQEPSMAGLVWRIPLGQVFPGSPCSQNSQDAVEHIAWFALRSSTPTGYPFHRRHNRHP